MILRQRTVKGEQPFWICPDGHEGFSSDFDRDKVIGDLLRADPPEWREQMSNDLNIKSNKKKTCLRCGCEITEENDSTWEKFTGEADADGNQITQPICKACDARDDEAFKKKEYYN